VVVGKKKWRACRAGKGRKGKSASVGVLGVSMATVASPALYARRARVSAAESTLAQQKGARNARVVVAIVWVVGGSVARGMGTGVRGQSRWWRSCRAKRDNQKRRRRVRECQTGEKRRVERECRHVLQRPRRLYVCRHVCPVRR